MNNGILIVNKPQGITSRDVVNRIGKILGTKKIGHTGTLDPLATGVLVLTIGKFTKLSNILTSEYKEYEVEFILGYETDTLDITGTKIKTSEKTVTKEEILDCIQTFNNISYNQEVPIYSAVKIQGKKLYEYAREHKNIELPKRLVEIVSINNIEIKDNIIKFTCLVSKGTYIRSLVRDIGIKLGTYATMNSLKRITQGKFTLNDVYDLDSIEKHNYKLLPIEDVLDIGIINLDKTILKDVSNGVMQLSNTIKDYLLYKYQNNDIALYKRYKDNMFKMFIKY